MNFTNSKKMAFRGQTCWQDEVGLHGTEKLNSNPHGLPPRK